MDVRQMQNLLQYLGYYEGNVDGISGTLTEQAMADFRQDNGNPNLGDELEEVLIGAVFHSRFKGKGTDVPATDFWSTVKYFRREEFACKCGKCGGYPVEPSEKLVRVLDAFREEVGLAVYINSGIRCKEHNEAVGGENDSRHLYGDAADIRCPGKMPSMLYNIAVRLLPDGGVGIYDWGVHVDTRGYKARWNG